MGLSAVPVEEISNSVPVKGQRRDPARVTASLQAWLRTHVPSAERLQITDLAAPGGAGVANETMLVATDTQSGFVVRIGAHDHLYLDTDVETAFRVYAALENEPGVPSPAVFGYEPDPSLFGAPFFVMERIEGLVPADNPSFYQAEWFTGLSEQDRRKFWRGSIETIAALHRVDPHKFAFLDRPALGTSGIAQDLNYWRNYARWCGADQLPIIRRAEEWLVANLPLDAPPGFSWGDARPQNIIYRDLVSVAVLDWDTASLAGAEADLAWWGYMAQGHTDLPGWGTGREMLAIWQDAVGREPEYLDWHLVKTAFALRAIMVRLSSMLLASGAIDPATAQRLDSGEMDWLAGLLDRPLQDRHSSAWPGWGR